MTATTQQTRNQALPAISVGWRARAVASAVSALAGVIHLWVVPEHGEQAWWVGAFFLAMAVGQLALAVALQVVVLRVGHLLAAAAANLGIICLYVASRLVDLPFLPQHHRPHHLPVAGGIGNGDPVLPLSHLETVGLLDLVCLLAELVLVGSLARMLPSRHRLWVVNSMLAIGVIVMVVGASALTH